MWVCLCVLDTPYIDLVGRGIFCCLTSLLCESIFRRLTSLSCYLFFSTVILTLLFVNLNILVHTVYIKIDMIPEFNARGARISDVKFFNKVLG